MITLEGKNLCERQKDLNFKVKKAAENKVDLQTVKCADQSDVDRIFKIDLASEYKNIDYLIEELKSGDSLYISRVLRCKWLYASDYAHIINPYYLDFNIFPMMSFKMKKKMLTMISVNMKDEARAEQFYMYCMKIYLKNNAEKFLIFTSEPFKLNILNDNVRCKLLVRDKPYFQHLIGSSFILANAYAESGFPLVEISYLYSVNEANYLDLLERYRESPRTEYLGVKISRSIMKKHKNRVLQNVYVYLSNLSTKVLLKYSSCEDAQIYLRAVLPQNEQLFWDDDYCNRFKHLINLLTTVSKFQFIKQIYEEKYGTSDFELNSKFSELQYHNLMTFEEREAWALILLQMQERITKSSAVLSEGDNYKYCEFMPFAKALSLIHYQLCKTTDLDKRSDMLRILVKSTRTKDDLETLLNYYYNKHVMSEKPQEKGKFLDTIIKYHNVFEFNNACWVAFDMILQNFQLHNLDWPHYDFLIISFIYRIIKDKTLPKHLRQFIHSDVSYSSKFIMYVNRLKQEERNLVFEHISSKIVNLILEYNSDVKWRIRNYLELFIYCRRIFDNEDEFPDVVVKFMKLDWKHYKGVLRDKYKIASKLTEGYLLRCLKQDASQVVEILPSLINEYNVYETFQCFRINMFLRKIKIFFSNDVAKQYLEYFTKALDSEFPYSAHIKPTAINGIVFAIFQLGDEKSKTELMDKFAPTNSRVEGDKMDHNDYITQVAICRFQCNSRPPVPLSKTALYINEDYIPKCEEMLYKHLSNLPPALRSDFIKLLLNSSALIQRRGINLAFQVLLKIDELKYLFAEVWSETRNITLRKKIYMSSVKRLLNRNGDIIISISSLLLYLTRSVREDDDDEILSQFSGEKIPIRVRGEYLEICWKNLAKWPETNVAHDQRKVVAKSIFTNRDLMNEEFLHCLIHDEVKKWFQRKLPLEIKLPGQLDSIFISLQCIYITDIPNDAKQERSLKIVELFTEECFMRWNDEHQTGILYYQEVYNIFLCNILKRPQYFGPNFLRIIFIAEKVLENFENKIGITEAYSRFWDWKLALITRKAINGRQQSSKEVYVYFGYYLGDFVRKLKEKNCYYTSFLEKVFRKISSAINDINQKRIESMSNVDASIMIVFGLIGIEMFENYVLALKILPTDLTVSPAYRKALLFVLRRIRSQNNEEFSAFLKEKFNNSEAKSRKLIESLRNK